LKYTLEFIGNGSTVIVTGADLDTMDNTVTAFGANKPLELKTPRGCVFIKPANALGLRVTNEPEEGDNV
jgi:hypothetical protein